MVLKFPCTDLFRRRRGRHPWRPEKTPPWAAAWRAGEAGKCGKETTSPQTGGDVGTGGQSLRYSVAVPPPFTQGRLWFGRSLIACRKTADRRKARVSEAGKRAVGWDRVTLFTRCGTGKNRAVHLQTGRVGVPRGRAMKPFPLAGFFWFLFFPVKKRNNIPVEQGPMWKGVWVSQSLRHGIAVPPPVAKGGFLVGAVEQGHAESGENRGSPRIGFSP